MFDAWGISIFVGFDFHNVDALRLKSRKELLTLLFRKLLILRIYSILFDGIKKLPAEHVEMEKELLLRWMAESQMLEKANVRLNDAAIQVSEWFRKKGFRTCILKGQGNALMYPNPNSRTPGDIDIWVEGKTNVSSPLSALSRLMKRRAITISSSHRIRVWRLKCIIGLAFCCASAITENFRNIMRG